MWKETANFYCLCVHYSCVRWTTSKCWLKLEFIYSAIKFSIGWVETNFFCGFSEYLEKIVWDSNYFRDNFLRCRWRFNQEPILRHIVSFSNWRFNTASLTNVINIQRTRVAVSTEIYVLRNVISCEMTKAAGISFLKTNPSFNTKGCFNVKTFFWTH